MRLRSLALLSTLLITPTVFADGRQVILLEENEREAVLAEMRQMLESVRGVVTALADEKTATAATAARAGGMVMAGDVPMELRQKLPMEFRRLGMATHQAFDTLAMAAEQGETPEMLLGKLGELMGNCTGCHATFRIDPAR